MDTEYGETGVRHDEVAGGVRLSPRALIGGVRAGLATQLLLMPLGAAIGLTAFEPSGAVMKGVGIGFSIWLILSLYASSFIGAWVTSAPSRRRSAARSSASSGGRARSREAPPPTAHRRQGPTPASGRTRPRRARRWGRGVFLALALSPLTALLGGSAAANSEGHGLARRNLPRRPLTASTPGTGPLPPTTTRPSPV